MTDIIINIEKLVINLNDTNKKLIGITPNDVVEFISSVINKEEKENKNLKNVGVCTSPQVSSHYNNYE